MTEVEVNGEKWPIKFGFDGLSKFQEMHNIPLSEFDAGNLLKHIPTFSRIVDLLYCGFWYGHKVEKKPFPYTRDEFEVICSDNPKIIGAASFIFNQQQPPEPSEEEKKSEVTNPQNP